MVIFLATDESAKIVDTRKEMFYFPALTVAVKFAAVLRALAGAVLLVVAMTPMLRF